LPDNDFTIFSSQKDRDLRSFKHWTVGYFINRISVFFYEKSNPEHPWLTKSANMILSELLKKSDIGLEFGSGRSTIYFAKRLKHLTSIEHNELWYNKVNAKIQQNGLNNINYIFAAKDKEDDRGNESKYVETINGFKDESFDFILVDGAYRDFCALKVLPKIFPGGILTVDNANLYLPCDSCSPDSRTYDQGPKGNVWKRFFDSVYHWRSIWTSNGVFDTAIFFKPYT
jgi:hypothetical protein